MLSKEEIEQNIEYKFSKSKKENFGLTIEEAKHIALDEDNMYYCGTLKESAKNVLLQYIAELETREQKLIDKLEEDINVDKVRWYNEAQLYGEIFRAIKRVFKMRLVNRKEYAQEILSIVKGEKNGYTSRR